MKKTFSILVGLLFLLSSVSVALAENDTTQAITSEQTSVDTNIQNTTEVNASDVPSIAPDQPILWGLKKAIENIDELLTFNKAEKAKKGLRHARERLLEVQKMITEKKLDAAEKGEKAHKEKLEKVKDDISKVESEDSKQELKDEIEIENEVEDQENEIKEVKNRLEVKIKGTLSEEQRARLDALIASFANSTASVKIKVNAEKDSTKIKIKAKYGKSDEEVNDIENELEVEIEEEHGIGEEVRELAKEQKDEDEKGIGKEVKELAKEQNEESETNKEESEDKIIEIKET